MATPITEITEDGYQALVAVALQKCERGWDTQQEKHSIDARRRNLQELQKKTLAWLKSNATQPSGLNFLWHDNVTWKELVRYELKFDLVA
jgi:hypothetical protein